MFVTLTLAGLLSFIGWKLYGRATDDRDNFYVGMTQQQIVERLGPPSTDGSRPTLWFNDEMLARREEHFYYARLNGDLLIRVWDDGDRRVCFASQLITRRYTTEAGLVIALVSFGSLLAFLEATRWWNRRGEQR